VPPANPAMLLPAFANLLSKGRITCNVTGLVRARVRVSINILLILHFVHLYSLDGASQ